MWSINNSMELSNTHNQIFLPLVLSVAESLYNEQNFMLDYALNTKTKNFLVLKRPVVSTNINFVTKF